MKNKDIIKNKALISLQPLVGIPPYRGDLHQYIREKQEEEKQNKLYSTLDQLINILEAGLLNIEED
jgi:hypothetical protein